MKRLLLSLLFLIISFSALTGSAAEKNTAKVDPTPFPGTKPLKLEGDITSQMVDGVDRFLLRQLEQSIKKRGDFWKRHYSSLEAYDRSIEPNRKRLAHILGVRDQRVDFKSLHLLASTSVPSLVGKGAGFKVFAVSWPAFNDVTGEGLLLVPTNKKPLADIVAIPDADQTPEQLVGLTEGVPAEAQFARRLAESGCRVLVPTLISREIRTARRVKITNREFIYRSAFEMGRHLIGYEVQKVLAGVDWFTKEAGGKNAKIGVIGYGEGGMLALYAAALDRRIDATVVSGYFDSRQTIWQQPISRNVFSLLEQFGDAELATMIAPRRLIVEASKGPELEIKSSGAAPAVLSSPKLDVVRKELQRAREQIVGLGRPDALRLVECSGGEGLPGSSEALQLFLKALGTGSELADLGSAVKPTRKEFDPQPRQQRQLYELDRHNQWLLSESPFVRKEYMNKLKTDSMEHFEATIEPYREYFRNEVVGHFDLPRLAPNVRSRKKYETDKWSGYEVVMDVFPDVFAYGVLLVPKDIKPGDKRPVVVCQHGLEGRPTDTFLGDHRAYHDFAAKLCERGFVTFAPQNLYIFKDRFRTLQRKSYPIKKTLFSIIVPQHQQITDWIASLPFVDKKRIAFYGLSYGGKSAMRIPPLVDRYCLSICSADFNEWVLKNASSRHPFSYVGTGEYEIYEFDLGSTFNYSEMAALICPRPFMVERGHFDGVGEDQWVAHEFAKVRNLYQARLGIGDRCEIEWFVGPHTINGQGTFDFLHKHLSWPKR